MLTVLRVRQLAIIDTLDLELGPGLNVVTGETGAGKSILIGALKLVLGGRANADLVRAGADRAEVEALFDLTASPALRARLSQLLGHEESELVIRRTVPRQGRSRAYVNGTLATAHQLAQLTEGLVDICSQHEHHTLVDPSSHLRYLDAFAELDGSRASVDEQWNAYRHIHQQVESLCERGRERTEREAVLRFQLEEIESVKPQADEVDRLGAEHSRLASSEQLAETTYAVERALYTHDSALCDQLGRLIQRLQSVRDVDPALDQITSRLDQTHAELEDASRDLGIYARNVVFDPSRLQAISDRLADLKRLERRYGGTLEAVLLHADQVRQELTALDGLDDELERLQETLQAAQTRLIATASQLSKARHGAAQGLGQAITAELSQLGMGDAKVRVAIDDIDGRGGIDIHGARYSATGRDRVEFLIAPNRGDPPKPLQRIASGGELSRALLAIKRVLSRGGPKGLYVFDEVDTGVGGGIAEVIGKKLRDVAIHHQVLCITHQPQIAVYGARHFHVSKATSEDRTASRVTQLDAERQCEEIARMMGGLHITDATRSAARDMIAQARELH